jgi:hypothetical protein
MPQSSCKSMAKGYMSMVSLMKMVSLIRRRFFFNHLIVTGVEPENDSYEERELPLPDMIFDSLSVQLMIIQKDMMDFIDLKGLASDAQGLMTSE